MTAKAKANDASDFTENNNEFNLDKADEGEYLKEEDDEFSVSVEEDLLEPGIYSAILFSATPGMNQNTGNEQIEFNFILTSGEWKGRKMKTWVVRNPASAWKMREVLTSLGVEFQGKTANFKKRDILNKPVNLLIETRNWNGRDMTSIKTVMPPDSEAISNSMEAIADY